jgi:hypothetical protein
MAVHTLRGIVNVGNSPLRLFVDDGRFTEGHRVKSFTIIGGNNGISEGKAVLTYSETGATSIDFENSDQIGWAIWDTDTTLGGRHFSIVDPDHLVNADLYISTITANAINFIIEVEPVTMTEAQGVLQLIKAKRQA